ncbi:MAG: hypothetical protein Q8Q12_06185 [bacterium]|nr:hypothetical protein [bacterium]
MSGTPNNGVGPAGAVLLAAHAPSIVEEVAAFGNTEYRNGKD